MPPKVELKLSHISHRYTLHDNSAEVFAAKFSPDCSYMGVCYSDNSVSIYSSMLGDPLYYIKDEEFEFPMTGLCWKPIISGS